MGSVFRRFRRRFAALAEQPDAHAVQSENGDFGFGADHALAFAGAQQRSDRRNRLGRGPFVVAAADKAARAVAPDVIFVGDDLALNDNRRVIDDAPMLDHDRRSRTTILLLMTGFFSARRRSS